MKFYLLVAVGAICLGSCVALDLARLEKSLGINLEERRLRLEKLGDHLDSTVTSQTEKVKSTSQIEREYLKGAESIVEINRKSGAAKYLFQADMNLNENQLQILEPSLFEDRAGSLRSKRQAERFSNQWISGKVFYYFDNTITGEKKISIKASIKFIEANTCLQFEEKTNAKNRIRFTSDEGGCFSEVGMQGGEQVLSIYDGCQSMGTVVHELMHALGYIHTQSRPDRDTYVQVYKGNVLKKDWGNFVRYPEEDILLYTPYEYGSVMHYSADAFQINYDQDTITANDPKYMWTMGGDVISFWDILMINQYYGCSGKCVSFESAKCLNEGVPNPSNCSKCICPLGYGGDLCDQKPAGCGSTLEAATTWKRETIRMGNSSNREIRDQYLFCNYWVTAPQKGKIEIRLSPDMMNSHCRYGCNINGIEFKVNKDKQQTNPRYCCGSEAKSTIISDLNPLPVIAYNRHWVNEFTIHYRYVDTPPAPTTKITQKPTITTKVTQKPTITTMVTQKPTARPTPNQLKCTDEWETELCENLSENQFCLYDSISEKCQHSCGVCSKPTLTTVDQKICKNEMSDSECDDLAKLGMCTQFVKECHKSCYQCGEKPN